jgi:hypothetical protein
VAPAAVAPSAGAAAADRPGMPTSTPWWSYRRVARNGRIEVACRLTDDHLYWLTPHELANWTVCAHCVGWISHWPAPVLAPPPVAAAA